MKGCITQDGYVDRVLDFKKGTEVVEVRDCSCIQIAIEESRKAGEGQVLPLKGVDRILENQEGQGGRGELCGVQMLISTGTQRMSHF